MARVGVEVIGLGAGSGTHNRMATWMPTPLPLPEGFFRCGRLRLGGYGIGLGMRGGGAGLGVKNTGGRGLEWVGTGTHSRMATWLIARSPPLSPKVSSVVE